LIQKAKAAVEAAKKGVQDAANKVRDAEQAVNNAQAKVNNAKNKLTSACDSLGEQLQMRQLVKKILAEENYDLDLDTTYQPAEEDLGVPVHQAYSVDHSVLYSMSSEYETLDQVPDRNPRRINDAQEHIHAPTRRLMSTEDRAGSEKDDIDADLADAAKENSAAKSQVKVDSKTQMKAGSKTRAGWHRWHVHIPHRWHVHVPHIHISLAAACRALTAPLQLILDAAKLTLKGVGKVLDGARALLRKVEEQLNNVINKMKDGLAAAKGSFALEHMSAGATVQKNILKSSISASIKVRVNSKHYSFGGSINLSSIKSFVNMVFRSIVKKLREAFGEYDVQQVLAMDEAQMDQMFMQVSEMLD